MERKQCQVLIVVTILVSIANASGIDRLNEAITKYREAWTRKLKSSEYEEIGLELHNILREEHNTPSFKYNVDLAEAAKATARAFFDGDGSLSNGYNLPSSQLRALPTYSQNVFNITDAWLTKRPVLAVLFAVSAWYEEYDNYNPEHPKPSSFTKLIWKSSTDFGIGLYSKENSTVVVGNYAPKSIEVVTSENIKDFQENVQSEYSVST